MNRLEVNSVEIAYEVNGETKVCRQTDFVVDGQGLSERLGFASERPWFGATSFEVSGEQLGRVRDLFLGKQSPTNQLGTERLVLYRCHCGVDYCGVISCRIERQSNVVRWLDIRYEDQDEGEAWFEATYPEVIERLCFDAQEYDAALLNYG